jgi:GT2 family glycosyltransferase
MSIDKSEITIVMVSFFSKNLIEKPINSIDQNIKIIVIENSNSKECKDFLENKYKNVRVVMSEKNLGNGAGINLGLKLVKTKYAFYLDIDTEFYQGTIEKLLHVSEQLEQFTILAPFVEKYEYKKNHFLRFDEEKGNKLKSMRFVPGCALLFNLIELSKIGFYDENFFLFFEEDDIYMRCLKKDHKIFMLTDAIISHTGTTSVDQKYRLELELDRNWHYMWSKFYFYKKHFNFLTAYTRTVHHFFSALIKLCFFRFINYRRYLKYKNRASGLLNSYLGNKSWKRPSIK